MKFSAQEEYGLRCLLALAHKGAAASMTIPEIARHEGLTEPHAAKILSILRKENFITSTRGQSGGYRLAKTPGEIKVGDVLNALGGRLFEESFCAKHTGVEDECAHFQACSLRSLWTRIQAAVDMVVHRITLQDVMDGRLEGDWVGLQSAGNRVR